MLLSDDDVLRLLTVSHAPAAAAGEEGCARNRSSLVALTSLPWLQVRAAGSMCVEEEAESTSTELLKVSREHSQLSDE